MAYKDKERERAYTKEYYEKNKESIKEYYIKNKEYIREKHKEYYEKHREHEMERMKEYNEQHKIEIICKTCGKKAKITYKKNNRMLYCSTSCAVRGENHPLWKGGISIKYCEKWTEELRELIREQYDRKCFICNAPENGRKLSVHHINFDKQSGCFGKRWNLVPLCQSCHVWTTWKKHEAFSLLNCHYIMSQEFEFEWMCGKI